MRRVVDVRHVVNGTVRTDSYTCDDVKVSMSAASGPDVVNLEFVAGGDGVGAIEWVIYGPNVRIRCRQREE